MRKLLLTICLLMGGATILLAQRASLHITIRHTTASRCYLDRFSSAFMYDFLDKRFIKLGLDSHGSAIYSVQLTKPQFLTLRYSDADSSGSKSYGYKLFLSPGDSLFVVADLSDIHVSGRGSRNNQPAMAGLSGNLDLERFKGDTLPNRVVETITEYRHSKDSILSDYVSRYHPTKTFIESWKYQLGYLGPELFYGFKGNNNYTIGQAYERNKATWQHAQDSLFATIDLNNDKALVSTTYTSLLVTYLLREKERLWGERRSDSSAFYRDWYDTTMDAGRLQFEDDPENLLQEKIISRDFTGDAQAYLYAVLLDVAMTERNTKNILAIFDRFRLKHPGSPYVAWFKPYMDTIREKQRSGLTDQMVFVKDNGTKLDSFSQVLALMKGKTVLLDMWGTWCGPCREELAKDGPIIKAHFKGKGLDYLYIANGDQGHEANWKHLIAYFKLDGTHILASENLDKDIMARVKGEGYPSYVIIKKDGTYTLSNAGHPTNVDELIKELEEALAN